MYVSQKNKNRQTFKSSWTCNFGLDFAPTIYKCKFVWLRRKKKEMTYFLYDLFYQLLCMTVRNNSEKAPKKRYEEKVKNFQIYAITRQGEGGVLKLIHDAAWSWYKTTKIWSCSAVQVYAEYFLCIIYVLLSCFFHFYMINPLWWIVCSVL